MKEVLIKLIELSGLSRPEVADKAGIAVARIYEWLGDKQDIKFATLEKIATALGYEVEVVIKAIEISKKPTAAARQKPKFKKETEQQAKEDKICDCKIDDEGLLRRGKVLCKLPKAAHKHLM